MRIFLEKRL